jgi:hypothetical protein
LLVVDLSSGALRTVDNAYGPVGFTPDGTTIVSYTYASQNGGPARPQLLLIDSADLSSTGMDVPSGQEPSYFVTKEGNDVVVASNFGNADLVIYDISMHRFVSVGGPPLGLENFVSRIGYDQLWLVDQGLYSLNFHTDVLEPVPLPWTPMNVNILPTHDLLVLDDANSDAIRFLSPTTRTVVQTVNLPLAD